MREWQSTSPPTRVHVREDVDEASVGERSQTTPSPSAPSNAPADFAFRQVNNVDTRVANDLSRK
jgi:hypothetical protein